MELNIDNIVYTISDYTQVEREVRSLTAGIAFLKQLEESNFITENIDNEKLNEILYELVLMQESLCEKHEDLGEKCKKLIYGKRGKNGKENGGENGKESD